MIGKILTQVVIRGNGLKSLSLRNLFDFEDFEDDYALLNINGKSSDYLKDLSDAVNRLYAKKEILTSKNIETLQIFLIFPYKEQGNAEIPTEILRKIVELNAYLCISFYESV